MHLAAVLQVPRVRLINDLVVLEETLPLILDDYHFISNQEVRWCPG